MELDIHSEELEKEANDLMKSLQVAIDKRNDIEEKTAGQNDNDNWFQERKNRLTASVFGPVSKRREKSTWAPLFKQTYDKASKYLPELRIGQPVVKQLYPESNTTWTKGYIVEKTDDSSYIVNVNGNKYRRSRIHIRPNLLPSKEIKEQEKEEVGSMNEENKQVEFNEVEKKRKEKELTSQNEDEANNHILEKRNLEKDLNGMSEEIKGKKRKAKKREKITK
ncbi:hypothetical protein ILUMI_16744 [Ignelater luminosus]|uniref:Uncharacterized protein n=1 Tax=Ignelater luminosus TaxID=2038154 RepID=A0A8K0CN01_IGNLU|nr:hypothetical protein ILUMI_16744 [Ignelater luminosus]